MKPQEKHLELINEILRSPNACVNVMTDLVSALGDVRVILASFPRPALEQVIAVVNRYNDQHKNSETIRTALTQIEFRLDALYQLL